VIHSNLQARVILSPKNEHCLQVNERVLGTLPGEVRMYISADSVKCDNEEERQNYPTEFLNSLTPSGMPPHRLNLKINAVVMLLRNLSLRQGLCNGTRLRVTHLHNNCVQATILTGASQGNTVLIPRIKLAPSDTNLPFVLERHQLPLWLAYSMTINKAQGQTFERVGINLPSPGFSHGQLNEAFSRARSRASVKVNVINTQQPGKRGGRTVTPISYIVKYSNLDAVLVVQPMMNAALVIQPAMDAALVCGSARDECCTGGSVRDAALWFSP
jgi:hypothetical protein